MERIYIQTGTSYGYPPSAITNHVSAIPNHQTLRVTPLSSRFNLACFGNLGYELNLLDLSKEELQEIKTQIRFYKARRELFQFGTFYRSKRSIYNDNCAYFAWSVTDCTKPAWFFRHCSDHPKEDIVHVRGLKEGIYVFRNRLENTISKSGGLINYVSPIRIKSTENPQSDSRIYKIKGEKEVYMVNAEMLEHSGIRLFRSLRNGVRSKVRVLGDFGSRIYLIDRAEDSKA